MSMLNEELNGPIDIKFDDEVEIVPLGTLSRSMMSMARYPDGSIYLNTQTGPPILVIVHHLLFEGQPCQDLGRDFFDKQDPERTTRRLIKRLEALGHQVTLVPQDAAA